MREFLNEFEIVQRAIITSENREKLPLQDKHIN